MLEKQNWRYAVSSDTTTCWFSVQAHNTGVVSSNPAWFNIRALRGGKATKKPKHKIQPCLSGFCCAWHQATHLNAILMFDILQGGNLEGKQLQ